MTWGRRGWHRPRRLDRLLQWHVRALQFSLVTFQVVRELSEADRNALERSLEIDDKRVPGVTAMAQRQIIRTLLAVSKSEEMRVGKLVIGILPLQIGRASCRERVYGPV